VPFEMGSLASLRKYDFVGNMLHQHEPPHVATAASAYLFMLLSKAFNDFR